MVHPESLEAAIIVLVVEDEFLIREAVSATLMDEGFHIHQAEHAASAIKVLENHWQNIHVIFTDVSMPGAMNGIGLCHHVFKHWPSVALLVTSALPRSSHGPLPTTARFIDKPYRSTEVVTHLRELAAS